MYVPTNHIYVGDIFLLGKEDVIHTNLSVREGLGDAASPELFCSLKQIHYLMLSSVAWSATMHLSLLCSVIGCPDSL